VIAIVIFVIFVFLALAVGYVVWQRRPRVYDTRRHFFGTGMGQSPL
jgi:hypothetical protein